MPEHPEPKSYSPSDEIPQLVYAPEKYAELEVATNFSFLRGASHPDELVFHAAENGYRAIAVTDRNSLAGIVRAHEAAKKCGLKLVIGARLILQDSPDILVWCVNRPAYARLCRLLTTGKRRADKGQCALWFADLLGAMEDAPGLLAAVVPPEPLDPHVEDVLAKLREIGGKDDRISLATSCLHHGTDSSRLRDLQGLARATNVPLLATNGVHYHHPGRRPLQDVLTCIRHGCTIQEAGYRLFPNGERYLKRPALMHHLFKDYPDALRRGVEIAERCTFSLDELKYEYPDELVPPGKTASEYLRELTEAGVIKRYPEGVPPKVRNQIEHELKLIAQLKYEAYFLTVYDLVKFARSRGILCQGRGSAANSAVCYCIEITSVDPAKINLLFERFVSAARKEPPDIDVDFEHERREEVLQYIFQKYGRQRAGMTAEVISYRGRSAVRDVGKALGLSLDLVDQMAKQLDGWNAGTVSNEQLQALGLDPEDRTIRMVVGLTSQLLGFPRHLSQHVGGMIMTRTPLCEMVPVENASMADRTVVEWDKDDIDAVGMLKVDVLALGMLTCISKAFRFIEEYRHEPQRGERFIAQGVSPGLVNPVNPSPERAKEGDANDVVGSVALTGLNASSSSDPRAHALGYESSAPLRLNASRRLELHTVPSEDPGVYEMICRADTIGVFQIESRAQMSMLPRLKPKEFYDLVIEVAIVRPGPIQGDMVHPYLRRRNGEEPVTFPNEALREVLGCTLGVPLFQEQAMKLVMVAAGFSAEEADQLRRAMAAWRKSGAIEKFRPKLIDGMLSNGYTQAFAEQCFDQIRGFGEYGFPESHAASFALLVYVSAWLKRYHPAAFAAALLNSQPMGFYAPAQIVRDAQEHGVIARPADINESDWDCLLEEDRHEGTKARRHEGGAAPSTWGCGGPVLRLGLRLIKGLRQMHADLLTSERQKQGKFHSIIDLQRRTGLPKATLRRLAEADAFGSLGLPRREALWQVLGLEDESAPLFDGVVEERHEGTKARRHEGTSSLSQELHGRNSNLSGLDRLAEGNENVEDNLYCDATNAEGRVVWPYEPDAAGGNIDSLQHCGGICPGEQEGLSQASSNCSGIAGRSSNTMGAGDVGITVDSIRSNDCRIAGGSGSSTARIDPSSSHIEAQISREKRPESTEINDHKKSSDAPSCLRASVPPCLPPSGLPPMPRGQEVMTDYTTVGLSLKDHPVGLVRDELRKRKILPACRIRDIQPGRWVRVAGLVLIRQRPGTASGVVFETLEDETGIVNLIIRPHIYERYRQAARFSTLVAAHGIVERQGDVIHVMVKTMEDLTHLVEGLRTHSRDFH